MRSNEELFRRFHLEGDAAAFEELCARLHAPLVRLARSAGARPSDVEDLVQETLLAAIVAAKRFDPSRDLWTWLRGILVNKCNDGRRHTARRQRRETPYDVADSVPADVLAQRDEAVRALHVSLRALSESDRALLQAYYWNQESPSEIARRQGRSASTVRSQVARSLVKLRRLLPPGLATVAIASLLLPRALRAAPPPAARIARRPSWRASSLAAGVVVVAVVAGGMLADGPDSGPRLTRSAGVAAVAAAPKPVAMRTATAARRIANRRTVAAPLAAPATPPADRPDDRMLALEIRQRGSGAPVAHLIVALQRDDAELGDGGRSRLLQALEVARTDEHGIARFATPATGRAIVRFGAAAHAETIDCSELPMPVVQVERVTTITGTVVDGRGQPTPGAAVYAVDRVRNGLQRPWCVGASDLDGRFQFAVADVARLGVFAVVEGLAQSRVTMVPTGKAPPAALTLPLEPAAGRLSGVVCGASSAAERTTVAIYPHDHAPVFLTPDASGRFCADTLPDGDLTVVAVAADGSSVTTGAHTGSDIDLDLMPAGALLGFVRAPLGAPLDRMTVVTIPLDAGPTAALLARVAEVEADGTFVLRGVPAGPVRVHVIDATMAASRGFVDVALGPGERQPMRIDAGRPRYRQSDLLNAVRQWLSASTDSAASPGDPGVADVTLRLSGPHDVLWLHREVRLRTCAGRAREYYFKVETDGTVYCPGLLAADYDVDVYGGPRTHTDVERLCLRSGGSREFSVRLPH